MTDVHTQTDTEARIAGGLLLAVSVLILLAMGHHPSGHGGGPVFAGLSLSAIVHSSMTAFWVANVWAFAVFLRLRGGRGFALAGFIPYAMSGVGHLLAALISGAITPNLAGRIDVSANHEFFILTWVMNQSLAALGVYLTGAAYALWGIGLLKGARGMNMLLGAAGLACGILPALALYSGWLSLDVQGALVIYGTHSLFAALIGIQMLRGRL